MRTIAAIPSPSLLNIGCKVSDLPDVVHDVPRPDAHPATGHQLLPRRGNSSHLTSHPEKDSPIGEAPANRGTGQGRIEQHRPISPHLRIARTVAETLKRPADIGPRRLSSNGNDTKITETLDRHIVFRDDGLCRRAATDRVRDEYQFSACDWPPDDRPRRTQATANRSRGRVARGHYLPDWSVPRSDEYSKTARPSRDLRGKHDVAVVSEPDGEAEIRGERTADWRDSAFCDEEKLHDQTDQDRSPQLYQARRASHLTARSWEMPGSTPPLESMARELQVVSMVSL